VSYTYYDYLDLPPDASPALIERAYVEILERFSYGATDTGQDMSGLIAMIHAAYGVLANPQARLDYDTTLAQEAAMADAELKATLDLLDGGTRPWGTDVPAALPGAFAAIAA
jgi:DnaJ-class molecular chaperone